VDPDPHHFGNLVPHPDTHPHKKNRIRIFVMLIHNTEWRNIFLMAYKFESVLYVHALQVFTFLGGLVEEKTIVKILLVSMKALLILRICPKAAA
jgi:hypothetical protein